MLDLAIIGGGPAALSAALYAARAGLQVKVYEKARFGGVLPNIDQIENYPGYEGAGVDLAGQMQSQAKKFGAQLEYGGCQEVWREAKSNTFRLEIDEEVIEVRTVLVATGSEPKQLSFTPNAPVSYCALCDGPLVEGKNVAVIGGANSAVQEALFLAKIAETVTIITHSQLKADSELLNRLPDYPNIKTIENLEPNMENLQAFNHIFVYIGKVPATSFLAKLAKNHQILDKEGYLLTELLDVKYRHQTAIPGLFAAGDVRSSNTKQVITAAADGVEAALEIIKYLA